jgi:hypothetical protein
VVIYSVLTFDHQALSLIRQKVKFKENLHFVTVLRELGWLRQYSV